MGKFDCTCGNTISDSTSPNEVTGVILSDKGDDEYSDATVSMIDDYIIHHDSGTVDEWRKKHFTEHYPDDCSPGQMLLDALSIQFSGLVLQMMECDACGRLWVQRENGVNLYTGYAPDDQSTRSKVLGLNTVKQGQLPDSSTSGSG